MAGKEQKNLFREMEADYAARREENRRAREGVPAVGPREASPGETAGANRHKPAGKDHGQGDGKEHSHGRDEGHSM